MVAAQDHQGRGEKLQVVCCSGERRRGNRVPARVENYSRRKVQLDSLARVDKGGILPDQLMNQQPACC